MKHCREWQETLWLDVYGELPLEERPKWEKHLEECKLCDQERTQLLYMLKNVDESIPEARLSHEDASDLYNTIIGKLKEEHRGKTRRRKSFFEGYIKPVHVLAACCLLIVVFGWFGLKGPLKTMRVGIMSDFGGQEQMIVKDIDLLENLELLEEMDTIEKLDQVLKG